MDAYPNFASLAAAEDPSAWRIDTRPGTRPGLHLAAHAGGIEAGSGEVALAVAERTGMSAYAFEGLLPRGNGRLHLTSTAFDEPTALAMITTAHPVFSWHGYGDDRVRTLIGGRDEASALALLDALVRAGFDARWAADCEPSLTGRAPRNIANRGAGGAGVQIEMSAGQRRRFFADGSLRRGGELTTEFARFVDAASRAITQTWPMVEDERHDHR